MIHIHELDGCAPAPLAHYLKALGILRLISEQADSDARGWWDGDHFRLGCRLSVGQLCEFFLRKYAPTPLLSPWNGASGFFKTWDEKKAQLRNSKNFDALNNIRKKTAPRWKPFRDALKSANVALEGLTRETDVSELTNKERANLLIVPRDDMGSVFPVVDKNMDKASIQREMQRNLNKFLFYRSAIIDVGADKPAYPSIWGSGGNDGAIDFTARQMENLLLVLDPSYAESEGMLISALTDRRMNALLRGSRGKVGQFIPGGAGGANSVNGFGSQNDTLLNPWDFVLMLEGAICFTSHVSRQTRLASSRAASPFCVNACGAAYASSSADDESARGEQWMPLWSQPLSYRELRQLLAEGRAQLGAKTASEPLDLARAVRRLGTVRGIKGFQRYGYIERNGQSNLAVPLGRFDVSDRPSEQLACIDDLDLWLHRLRREARGQSAPARLTGGEKQLTDALFAVTEHFGVPEFWQGVLFRLMEIEDTMSCGTGFAAGPVPRLRPEWVTASYDGTAEFRLALAFALQARGFRTDSGMPVDPIRRHWLPLDREQPWRFATSGTGGGTRLDVQPDVVIRGRRGIDDAIALLNRRLVEASHGELRHLPLKASPWASASIPDLTKLLDGNVNIDRTLRLARPLMALNRKAWVEERHISYEPPRTSDWPDDAWLAIRLSTLPWMLETRSGFKLDVGTDPAIIRRLATGDGASAVALALQRLRAAGVCSTVRVGAAPPDEARLWAAALAFPITQRTARQFLYRLDPNKERS